MKPDVPAEALPEEDFTRAKAAVDEKGWPKTGHGGRLQHTVDPDARDRYRAGKNLSRKGVFVGWDLHTATDTPDLGADARPPLFRALSLAPAGSLKSEPGLALVDALASRGHRPETVRGPGVLLPEAGALGAPVGRARGPAGVRPAPLAAGAAPRPDPGDHLTRWRTVHRRGARSSA